MTPFSVDLSDLAEWLRGELRAELLEELRAERVPAVWPEWMSVETAARYMDVSEERVRKLQARGAIPFYQEGLGCRVFFRRLELDEAMAALRHAPREGGL